MDDAECECSINANRDGRLFEAAARNATARLGGRAAATDTRAYRAIAQIYYMWVNRARKEEERERGGAAGPGRESCCELAWIFARNLHFGGSLFALMRKR
jgi:hypothetical protein